jgi:hypothetical protein
VALSAVLVFSQKFGLPDTATTGGSGMVTATCSVPVQPVASVTTTVYDVIGSLCPVAQSFIPQRTGYIGRVELWFFSKDDLLGVEIQIRNMVNGYPGQVVLGKVALSPADVNVSNNASVSTGVIFTDPVYVIENQEYCITVLDDSDRYRIWTARLGQEDVLTGEVMNAQPNIGVFFKSANNTTWTADQYVDMKFRILFATLALGISASATAEDNVLNLYSARHYQTDEALYENFTKQTGIKINRIEGKEDELLERIKNEGANSPADILLTVDAARLAKAHELGLFSPVSSKVLESRIPAHLRTEDWFSFSTRARVIVYNKTSVKAEQVSNYDDLANPALGPLPPLHAAGRAAARRHPGPRLSLQVPERCRDTARTALLHHAAHRFGQVADQLKVRVTG